MKLHLGCGSVSIDGWINIDRRYQRGVDRVDNIGILKQYDLGSVSAIYCCHALDHFSRWEIPRVLRRWRDLLKPGGKLYLSVIDFEGVLLLYQRVGLRPITGMLVAAQDYPDNVRHMHWDFNTLHEDLVDAGFSSVQRVPGPWNWTAGCHHSGGINGLSVTTADCSHAQIDGTYISLNVEAIR